MKLRHSATAQNSFNIIEDYIAHIQHTTASQAVMEGNRRMTILHLWLCVCVCACVYVYTILLFLRYELIYDMIAYSQNW